MREVDRLNEEIEDLLREAREAGLVPVTAMAEAVGHTRQMVYAMIRQAEERAGARPVISYARPGRTRKRGGDEAPKGRERGRKR
jgi:hypothetical protein